MNEQDKELWGKSQQWDISDDGRGKLKILESVEKFADLIRADEREACAKFLEHIDLGNLPPDLALYYASLINSLVNGIRARVNT